MKLEDDNSVEKELEITRENHTDLIKTLTYDYILLVHPTLEVLYSLAEAELEVNNSGA